MEWENQRHSASSTPSSMSSHPVGNRPEKIPTLKQISPSPSVSALSKLTNEDLRRKGAEDLVNILRRVEADYKSLMAEHGNVVKDVNRRFQIFVLEIRSLKEVNQKLQDDNQELRDLCCFLDDDRQRGRKLAREWQRFGRYTASVMRSEVAVYQEKLRELEDRQSELVTENMELKELCLYLDQERVRMTGDRDEGDGSSNGTVTGHEDGTVAMDTNGSSTPTLSAPTVNNFPLSSSTAASYIRELEFKVHQLEEEKKQLAQRIAPGSAEGDQLDGVSMENIMPMRTDQSVPVHVASGPVRSSGKPDAVVHAMQVLQVHEELEMSPREEERLDDSEKAIVREMCNVVWRKLGDVGDIGSFNESSDSLLDPPFVPESPTKPDTSLTSPGTLQIGQGQAHLYSVAQPLPQMTSTPLNISAKPTSGPAGSGQDLDLNHFTGSHPISQNIPPRSQEHHHPHHLSHRPLQNVVNQRQMSQVQPTSQLQYPSNPPSSANSQQYSQSVTAPSRPNLYPTYQPPDTERRDRQEERNLNSQLPLKHPESPLNLEDRRNKDQSFPHHPTVSKTKHFQPAPQPFHASNPPPNSLSHHPHSPSHHPQPQSNSEATVHGHKKAAEPTMSRTTNPPRPHYHQHSSQQQQQQTNPMPTMHRNPQPKQLVHPQLQGSAYGGQPYGSKRNESTTSTQGQYPPQYQRTQSPRSQQPGTLTDSTGGHYSSEAGDGRVKLPRGSFSTDALSKNDSYSEPHPHSRGSYNRKLTENMDPQSRPAQGMLSSASAVSQQNVHTSIAAPSSSASQPNLQGIPGFRAYPPQVPSGRVAPPPPHPVSARGSRGQDRQPTGSNMNTFSHHVAGSGPGAVQSKPNSSKHFQEQEWRQTYLDDTL